MYLESQSDLGPGNIIYGSKYLPDAVISGNIQLFEYLRHKSAVSDIRRFAERLIYEATGSTITMLQHIINILLSESDTLSPNSISYAYQHAAVSGNLDMLQYLDSLGLYDYNSVLTNALVLFHASLNMRQDLDVVKYVVSHMPDLHTFIPYYAPNADNPILGAIRAGNLEIVKYLLQQSRLTMDTAKVHVHKAFDYAAYSGSIDVFEYLVESGLRYDPYWLSEMTATAAKQGHMKMVKYLIALDHRVDTLKSTKDVRNALLSAVDDRDEIFEVMKYLIEYLVSQGVDRDTIISDAQWKAMARRSPRVLAYLHLINT
jgi:ankyrin repeat protein